MVLVFAIDVRFYDIAEKQDLGKCGGLRMLERVRYVDGGMLIYNFCKRDMIILWVFFSQ